MVNWLVDYMVGCVLAMMVVGLIAIRRRKSNDMPTRSVVKLAVSAGLVWPLLAVAALQGIGFFVLSKVFGVLRRHGDSAEQAADVPVLASVEPRLAAPAVAAA